MTLHLILPERLRRQAVLLRQDRDPDEYTANLLEEAAEMLETLQTDTERATERLGAMAARRQLLGDPMVPELEDLYQEEDWCPDDVMDHQEPEDTRLADHLIERLNTLIEDPIVKRAVFDLIEARVPCPAELLDHKTIQVDQGKFGFLGLLNGLVGVIPEGPKAGWGYITMYCDEDTGEVSFYRTNNEKEVPNE